MDNLIKGLGGIEADIRKSRIITVTVAVVALIFCLGCLAGCLWYCTKNTEKIYVLDQGHSLIAMQAEDAQTKDMEIVDHVKMFHMLFFNLAPNKSAIETNISKAMYLCDNSARAYYKNLSEKNYLQELINYNIVQQAIVDSVKVNTKVYPYKAAAFVTYWQIRESRMSMFSLVSTCDLINTHRSETNTHGLMMENFIVVENKFIEEKERN